MSSRYGEWPEGDPRRCDGCRFAECVERIMAASGDVREVYRCARRPEFVRRARGETRCNYWEARDRD